MAVANPELPCLNQSLAVSIFTMLTGFHSIYAKQENAGWSENPWLDGAGAFLHQIGFCPFWTETNEFFYSKGEVH
jgi:hypothetical protein